jgi:hypothetical protein
VTPANTIVAVLSTSAEHRQFARLARALHMNVRCFRRSRDATRFIGAHAVAALVASPSDAAGCPVAPALATMRRAVPTLGVVIVVARASSTPAMLAALRHADHLLFTEELSASSLWAAVHTARARRRRSALYASVPTQRL